MAPFPIEIEPAKAGGPGPTPSVKRSKRSFAIQAALAAVLLFLTAVIASRTAL